MYLEIENLRREQCPAQTLYVEHFATPCHVRTAPSLPVFCSRLKNQKSEAFEATESSSRLKRE